MTHDLVQRLRIHGNMGNKWSMELSHKAADRILVLESSVASRDAEIAYLQSRIDELMLEYCPNEMTKDQLDNWAAHQRPVGESELPEAIRAKGDTK